MIIAPSILAADFMNLNKDIQRLNNTDCEWLHLDVMDGKFVDDITFGYPLIKEISKITSKKLDVHLMVEFPFDLAKKLCLLKVDLLTVHIEVLQNIDFKELKKVCEENDVKLGFAINPNTKIEEYKQYLNEVNYILLMSVYPGKGGQSFMEEVLQKEKEIRALENGQNILINIDGGINDNTIDKVKETSINAVVSGSYIFSGDIQEKINTLR